MNQARQTIRRRSLPVARLPVAAAVRPRVICVENVCEFRGPLHRQHSESCPDVACTAVDISAPRDASSCSSLADLAAAQGFEPSLFRRADLAIRHDPRAVSLHLENRPLGVRGVATARGFKSSLFQRLHLTVRHDSGAVSFRFENRSLRLGLAWHSPICLPFRRSASRIAKLDRGAAS